MNSPESQIPEEILRSEAKAAANGPQGSSSAWQTASKPETILGLPALPDEIVGLLVKYGPWLLLASGAFGAINGMGFLMQLSSPGGSEMGSGLVWGSFVSMVAAVGMILAFVWLRAGRRMGWNMAVGVLLLQFVGGLLMVGGASILFSGVQLLVTGYLLLQVRPYFSK